MNELFEDETYKPLLMKSTSYSVASPGTDDPTNLTSLNSVQS